MRLIPGIAVLVLGASCAHPPAPSRPARAPAHPPAPAPAPAPEPAPAPARPPEDRRARPHAETGLASFYASMLHGRLTASGARYDEKLLTCAHRTLPFGSRVRVTELAGGRSVVLTVNDRGPFVKGRIVDVSREAARQLGILESGVARVRLERLR